MIVGFAIVFFINKLFFIFFLALFFIYLIVILKDIGKINNILNNQFKYYARAWGFTWEKYIHIKSVKLASFIDKEVSQLKKYLIKGGYFWNKKEFIWMKIGFLQKISTLIMQLIIFSFSVYLIFQKELTIGELIVVNSYSMFILGPLVSLASQSASLQTNIKRLKDLDDLITKLPQENQDTEKEKK